MVDPELAAFGASDAACYLYPGEGQQPERAAYCQGASDAIVGHENAVAALAWIWANYANPDLSHADFRVEAARRAEPFLARSNAS